VLPDQEPLSAADGETPSAAEVKPPLSPWRAAAEVLLCSDFPTQLAIGTLLGRLGITPLEGNGQLSSRFVYLVSAIDTVVLLALILLLLRLSGDRPRDLFIGQAKPRRELALGLALLPVILGIVFMLQAAIYLFAPFLRNVPESPFQSMIGSPVQTAAFVGLVLIAGGVREELQRAFLLHRFDQSLGGARIGVVITSIGFGLGHAVQGWDAMLVTGVLGAIWGSIYVWRRNVLPTIVSHALFNVVQVLLALAARHVTPPVPA
jgi:membrane protease YdiL (CAAX protease family)